MLYCANNPLALGKWSLASERDLGAFIQGDVRYNEADNARGGNVSGPLSSDLPSLQSARWAFSRGWEEGIIFHMHYPVRLRRHRKGRHQWMVVCPSLRCRGIAYVSGCDLDPVLPHNWPFLVRVAPDGCSYGA